MKIIFLIFLISMAQSLESSEPKKVFADYIVSNSLHSDAKTLQTEMNLAISTGIDGFALSVTKSSLMPSLISNLFEASLTFPDFKLYFFFDMTQINDLSIPIDYIKQYHNHPNYFHFQGKPFVSTLGGEMLKFGENSTNLGWEKNFKQKLKEDNIDIFFVPSWYVFDTVEASKYDIYSNNVFTRNPILDGGLNWAGAWSTSNDYKTNYEDEGFYKAIANSQGKIYMAAVSPWFSQKSLRKNWIYKSEILYPKRWKEIVEIQPDLVLIVSWNNGEDSSYIAGDFEGFDHMAWLNMTSYYISGYKNEGKYPNIIQDQVTFWYRPHSKRAFCQQKNSIGLPTNAEWAEDKIIVHAILAFGGQVIVINGHRRKVFKGQRGINVFELPFQEGAVEVSLWRNKRLLARKEGVKKIEEGFIEVCNFNAHVDKLVYRMNNAGNFRKNIVM